MQVHREVQMLRIVPAAIEQREDAARIPAAARTASCGIDVEHARAEARRMDRSTTARRISAGRIERRRFRDCSRSSARSVRRCSRVAALTRVRRSAREASADPDGRAAATCSYRRASRSAPPRPSEEIDEARHQVEAQRRDEARAPPLEKLSRQLARLADAARERSRQIVPSQPDSSENASTAELAHASGTAARRAVRTASRRRPPSVARRNSRHCTCCQRLRRPMGVRRTA